MTAVKICGISKMDELSGIREGKPDYMGLVFAPSKRQVTPDQAAQLVKGLDASILRVGVFVNKKVTKLLEIAEHVSLDIIQLHGDESPDDCSNIKKEGYQVWKSFSIKEPGDLEQTKEYLVDGYLLDASGPLRGGNGVTFPWEWVRDLSVKGNLILAGGLHSDNVQEAIETVKPDVLDLSSGVEENGMKSGMKICEVIEKVRSVKK